MLAQKFKRMRRRIKMPKLDIQEETRLFEKKINEGYFEKERSKNCEVNYEEEKRDRDTAAVKEFLDTSLFNHIRDM